MLVVGMSQVVEAGAKGFGVKLTKLRALIPTPGDDHAPDGLWASLAGTTWLGRRRRGPRLACRGCAHERLDLLPSARWPAPKPVGPSRRLSPAGAPPVFVYDLFTEP